jgi:hypothetical protein
MSRPLAWRLSGTSAFMPFHPPPPILLVLAHINSAVRALGDQSRLRGREGRAVARPQVALLTNRAVYGAERVPRGRSDMRWRPLVVGCSVDADLGPAGERANAGALHEIRGGRSRPCSALIDPGSAYRSAGLSICTLSDPTLGRPVAGAQQARRRQAFYDVGGYTIGGGVVGCSVERPAKTPAAQRAPKMNAAKDKSPSKIAHLLRNTNCAWHLPDIISDSTRAASIASS